MTELIVDFPERGPADHYSPGRDVRCNDDNERGPPFLIIHAVINRRELKRNGCAWRCKKN